VISSGLRLSHTLMTVMSMQMVHIVHVQLLRLALQCHALIYIFEDSVSAYSTVNEGLQMKDHKSCLNIDLWEWLLVGVTITRLRNIKNVTRCRDSRSAKSWDTCT